jgi:RNA polymerase sigma-70 factor, ECF subfamily
MNASLGSAVHPDSVALAAADSSAADLSLPNRDLPNVAPNEDAGASAPLPEADVASHLKPVAPAPVANLKELTKAICRGDEQAFTQFYDLYSLRLYKHLLVLTKGDEREAREVLQTAVVKLARRFKVFDEERRMWGWLCQVARNAYVDLCRTRQRDQRLVPLVEHQLVDGRAEEHRLSESLHHALQTLTVEEQELMRAAYMDERPLQELAIASGQTYKAVESRLARLRQKLKTNLLKHLRHEK